jgi:hypothetical protein
MTEQVGLQLHLQFIRDTAHDSGFRDRLGGIHNFMDHLRSVEQKRTLMFWLRNGYLYDTIIELNLRVPLDGAYEAFLEGTVLKWSKNAHQQRRPHSPPEYAIAKPPCGASGEPVTHTLHVPPSRPRRGQ